MNQIDFYKKISPNSAIDTIATDTTFSLPNTVGINRGLTKIFKNGQFTGQILMMTRNRMNKNIDINDYYISKYKEKIEDLMFHILKNGDSWD